MSKYNKSQIFKDAWNLVKTSAVNFSTALKKAWADFKSNLIIDKNSIILTKFNHKFVRETEKAICILVGVNCSNKSDGFYVSYENVWVPKSAIIKLSENISKLASWFTKNKLVYGISAFI